MNPQQTVSVWERAARNRLLDVGLITIAAICVARIALALPTRASDFDFNHYYVSSRLLLEGQDPYTTPLEPMSVQLGFTTLEQTPTATNPPGLLWMFVPFALCGPRLAFGLWVAVEILSLGVILWLIHSLLFRQYSRRAWRIFVAAVLISEPVYWSFFYSHVELPLAAIVLASYAAHKAGKHTAACLGVATAGMLKLYPFVLLPWFLWRSSGELRGKTHRTVAVVAWVLLGICATGLDLWRDFLQDGLRVIGGWTTGHAGNFSLPSFVMNLGEHCFSSTPQQARFWQAVGIFLGILCVFLAYLHCWSQPDPDFSFSLLCAAMVAASMTSWPYYFVFLIFPVAAATLRLAANPSGVRVLVFALVVLALNNLSCWQVKLFHPRMILMILANYVPLYGLLGFAAILIHYSHLRPPHKEPHGSLDG